MTIAEAKKELSEIGKLSRAICTLQETIARNREKLTSLSAPLNPDKVQSTHSNDKLAESMGQIMEFEDELNQKISDLTTKRLVICQRIYQLQDIQEQMILAQRYLNDKEWVEIAEFLTCSVRQVLRIHANGVKNYAEFNT